MVINVLDMPFENLLRHFKPAVEFIKNAIKSGGTVLVHCFAGVSRSASVVIAYLMKEMGLPALDAMTYTRKRRPIVFPNPGFQRQLFEFEKHLTTFNAKVMKDYQERKKKRESEQQQRDLESLQMLQQKQHYRTGMNWSQNLSNRENGGGVASFSSDAKKDRTSVLHNIVGQVDLKGGASADKYNQSVSGTKGTALSKLLSATPPSIDAYSPQNLRAQTQQVASRRSRERRDHDESTAVKVKVFDPQDTKKLNKILQKEGFKPSSSFDPKQMQLTHPLKLSSLSNTMQSSYARDYAAKPQLDSNKVFNYSSLKQSNVSTSNNSPQQQYQSQDRRYQSFKGGQGEQRSTTLIQHTDIRGVNQHKAAPVSVSQQYFYQTQRSPQKVIEEIYSPGTGHKTALQYSGQKTLQEKHQRQVKDDHHHQQAQHLEKPPLVQPPRRVPSAKVVVINDFNQQHQQKQQDKHRIPASYLQYEKPLINTNPHGYDSRKDIIGQRTPKQPASNALGGVVDKNRASSHLRDISLRKRQ